jgi:hypothetical protein
MAYRQIRSVPRRSEEGFEVTVFEPRSSSSEGLAEVERDDEQSVGPHSPPHRR